MTKKEREDSRTAVLERLVSHMRETDRGKAKAYLEATGMTLRQLETLDKLGYGLNPASAGHHLNVDGGLISHSINVTGNMLTIAKVMGVKWDDPRSPYVIGMFHDLVKCYCYMKAADGSWTFREHRLGRKHGEASVVYSEEDLKFKLTDQERRCIRHHMGAYGLEGTALRRMSRAMEAHPREILCTQTADCMAAYLDENERKNV